MPPVTPSTWRNTRLADRFAPVCPQVPPVSGDDALFDMPRGRLAQLRRILPLLANQSEDCLYLNLYVPRSGKLCVLSLWFFFSFSHISFPSEGAHTRNNNKTKQKNCFTEIYIYLSL